MTVRELVWSTRALTELDEIIAFIRNQDPEAAHRVTARIDERVASLVQHPVLGRPGRVRHQRTRRYALHRGL
jgi:toxin ParE1/3/4